MFKRKTAAVLLSAVIMAASSTAAFAETAPQVVVVEREYAASAAKTWNGKDALKAGQKYVVKKNTTVSGKVTLPKGATLTVNKGAKLTIGSKGALTVKGTLSVKSGATVVVNGTLTAASGSKITDAGTVKFGKTAKVTLGGKFTVSKTGTVSGTPKSIKLGKKGTVAINGKNTCKKLAALLDTAEEAVTDTAKDKKEIEDMLNGVCTSLLKDGNMYAAVKSVVPESYFDESEKAFNEYISTLDKNDEAYGMTYEQFFNSLFSALLGDTLNSIDSVKVTVTDLTDCKSKLTDEQKEMFKSAGDIAKAYVAKVSTDTKFKEGVDTSNFRTAPESEITVVNCNGKWYIAG